MSRREFSPTPEWAAQVLIDIELIQGEVLDCCAGDGRLALELSKAPLVSKVHTNEYSTEVIRPVHTNLNPSKKSSWENLPKTNWIITRPPFIEANRIIPSALDHVIFGVAALLKLSFLEPTFDRQDFLSRTPPTKIIVLPRLEKNDSITTAWMIWRKNRPWESGSIVVMEK